MEILRLFLADKSDQIILRKHPSEECACHQTVSFVCLLSQKLSETTSGEDAVLKCEEGREEFTSSNTHCFDAQTGMHD